VHGSYPDWHILILNCSLIASTSAPRFTSCHFDCHSAFSTNLCILLTQTKTFHAIFSIIAARSRPLVSSVTRITWTLLQRFMMLCLYCGRLKTLSEHQRLIYQQRTYNQSWTLACQNQRTKTCTPREDDDNFILEFMLNLSASSVRSCLCIWVHRAN